MQNRRRFVGVATGCAVAIATVLGVPAASAQPPIECITCEPHQPPAFGKSEAHGAPDRAFEKINKAKVPAGAFEKIPGGEVNPGNSGNAFGKH